jgi:hypothetical protein
MKRLLVLVAAAILITSAAAQDAKITGNRWASDALILDRLRHVEQPERLAG